MFYDNTRIIILCTCNSSRSQMAEGFIRHYLNKINKNNAASNLRSAGLEPLTVNPNAIKVMTEVGIDISEQTSGHFSQYKKDKFDLVITVCDNAAANCPRFRGDWQHIHWSFPDPAKKSGTEEEVLAEFRRVRDMIKQKIAEWLDK